MEKAGRKVLHQRSNSRNNVDVQSLGRGSSDGQVSDKDYQGRSSVSVRDLPTPTKGKGAARPRTPTQTPSIPGSAANSSISLGSIGSLPPIPPLRVHKIAPLAIKKQKKDAPPPLPPRSKGLAQFFYPPAQERRPSIYVDTATRSASNSTADTVHSLVEPRPLPRPGKPILKKSPSLGPDTVEDYEEKRSSWREHNQTQAHVYARMSRRSLRIVRGEQEEEEEEEGEKGIVEEKQVGPGLETSHLIQAPQNPAPILVAQTQTPPGPVHIPGSPIKRPPSNQRANSLRRTNSFLRPSSSKGIPSWARYFYSRGENLIETPEDEEPGPLAPPNQSRLFTTSNSLTISPLAPVYLPPLASPQRPRTSGEDSEAITQRSYPHLNRASYPIAPTEDLKNRHIVMFCLGFLLPFCWLIGALLPLPRPSPQWSNARKSVTGEEYGILENCSFDHLRKYRNSQYWRRVNRFMAPVGLLLMGAIIALGIVASRIS